MVHTTAAVEPLGQYWPTLQLATVVTVGQYRPAAQGWQVVLTGMPRPELYVPALHATQTEAIVLPEAVL